MANYRIPGPLCVTKSEPIDKGTLCLHRSTPPGPLGVAVGLRSDGAQPSLVHNDRELLIQEGLQIALTPLQLAAVLSGESLEEKPTLSNRLWGVGKLIGGALELLGAAGLMLAPEPTTLTKLAGGALGAHGLDTSAAAMRQIVTGTDARTFTADAAKAASASLGLEAATAEMIGLSVDLAIPLLAGGIGALRVIAVRRGSLSLAVEEAAGGHTIVKHVGQTEAQLRARLARELRIPSASTFKTLADAERHVTAALRANKSAIESWAKSAPLNAPPKAFNYQAAVVVGEGVVRATGQLQQMTRLVVVLRRVQQQNRVFFILTAYPRP